MRILFFGSSDFAAPALRALAAAGLPPAWVVTHPDRPGRHGRRPAPAWIRLLAAELGLPCLQTEAANGVEFLARVRELSPDLALVISFGQIFGDELLAAPRLGCWNVHASLLPRFRGAAPIRRALLAGEPETGITVIRMVRAMDAGPVLLRRPLPIPPREDSVGLRRTLAALAGSALVEAVRLLAAGEPLLAPQDETLATYAPKVRHEEGRLDWREDAIAIDRKVRALLWGPGAFTILAGGVFHIQAGEPEAGPAGEPGRILAAGPGGIVVAAGSGAFRITRLKREGGREVAAGEFLQGWRGRLPERLG